MINVVKEHLCSRKKQDIGSPFCGVEHYWTTELTKTGYFWEESKAISHTVSENKRVDLLAQEDMQ